MRSKILIIITAMLIFGVGFAVYAYNSTSTTTDVVAASCCCCSGDSCPMKAKGEGSATSEHSCPMMSAAKQEGMAGHKMAAGAKHEMKADGDGHSCPMLKDAKAVANHDGMKHSADNAAHSCSCACCAAGKEKKDKIAI